MAETNRSTVVGVFPTEDQAERAIKELLQAGFRRDNIGFFLRDGSQEGVAMQKDSAHYGQETVTRTATGTIAGSILGGLVGTITAILLPGIGTVIGAGIFVAGSVASGALAGGFTGLMSTVGLSAEEAQWFQGELKAGRPVVAIQADHRYSEAVAIMQIHGAYDMTREKELEQHTLSETR